MEQKLQLIRGARILQQLAEDSTPLELERNIAKGFPQTTKRQHATDPVRIVQIKYVPFEANKELKVTAIASSAGKNYDTVIQFNDVEFQPEDLPTNTTFIAADNETYNILPISLSTHTVKIRCDCLDFYHRFAMWNFNDSSLYGPKMPTYIRKTTTRPDVNPLRVPGVCKHVLRTLMALRDAGMITK